MRNTLSMLKNYSPLSDKEVKSFHVNSLDKTKITYNLPSQKIVGVINSY